MDSDVVIESLLRTLSESNNLGTQLTEETLSRVLAQYWDSPIMLEVLASRTPPPIREILMRRVSRLTRGEKLVRLGVIVLAIPTIIYCVVRCSS